MTGATTEQIRHQRTRKALDHIRARWMIALTLAALNASPVLAVARG
ncbi:MAG: hypothetical protein QOI98_3249 [Solirubrobacteraceae bacterium]|jgi:hypothetical protein|nr:hypothetical protein [Solirubrobacteraceae bacterium]